MLSRAGQAHGCSSKASAKLPGQLKGRCLLPCLPGLLSGHRGACLLYILFPCLLSAKGPEQLSFSSSYFPPPFAPPTATAPHDPTRPRIPLSLFSGRVINMQRMAPLL